MLRLYKEIMGKSERVLRRLLKRRLRQGKEHPERLKERKGEASLARPNGFLCWLHAASVGEAQSALILIEALLARMPNLHVLVTSGTLTSATMLESALPERAFHQFYPLDHPAWTQKFLDHWHPDLVLWMESELWPNMLQQIEQRTIPALLLNARLSDKSYRAWRLVRRMLSPPLAAFQEILCQTPQDAKRYKKLGARGVQVTDNIKFSARPLPCDEEALANFCKAIADRPRWVFASTHKGEEELAARVHDILHTRFPDLLTIIVPRHPERREGIASSLEATGLKITLRGEEQVLPDEHTEVYVADTLGELGLFYRAAPAACIGRSFSDDGGGGHNPIEAAQLGCAILHGPDVQNLQDIFDAMNACGAGLKCDNEGALAAALAEALSDPSALKSRQQAALEFARSKERVIDQILPFILDAMNKKPASENAA